jgi:catechol 2,3-dioxygenase-like lactoylglutathione lyase family enzyme
MALRELQHFLVLAEDLEATRHFYVDVLGFHAGARPPFPFPGYWLYLGDVPRIHVAPARAEGGQEDYLGARQAGRGTGAIDHMAFIGDELDAMIENLEGRNIPFRHRIVPEQGVHQLFVEDPNGVTLELNFFLDKVKEQENVGHEEAPAI